MFLNKTRQFFVDLYVEGGIVICTPDEVSGQELLCRTVIQPDGDIITWVSHAAVSQPDAWRSHFGKIENRMGSLRKVRAALKWGPGVPLALGAAHGLVVGGPLGLAVSAGWVLAGFLAKAGLRLSLRQILKRKSKTA